MLTKFKEKENERDKNCNNFNLCSCCLGFICLGENKAEQESGNLPKVTVGIFDSRAVAVAFAHSGFQKEIFKAKEKQMAEAVAADDKEK